MRDKIIVATIVYDDYIEMFESVCLKSLLQSNNLPWLFGKGYNVEYRLYTKAGGSADALNNLKDRRKDIPFEVVVEPYETINSNFLKRMVIDCVEANATCLFLNPDYFYADGCIRNLISYNYSNDMCVAALHMRVDSDMFRMNIEGIEEDIPPARLVNIAMGSLHRSWSESFIDNHINNSHISGSMVQPIGDKMWAVTFRIPTVFLANFNESDKEQLQAFDKYDHEWPAHLMSQNRFKFTGSSDFFFAVELTPGEINVPPRRDGMKWNDEFHVSRDHSNNNRNFLVIVRGE